MHQAEAATEFDRLIRARRFFEVLRRSCFYLAIVYLVAKFTVWWLTGGAHNVILPLLRLPSSEGRVEFAFNRLALFSILCGLISGLVAATDKHRAAQLVWIVPRHSSRLPFATFPESVFESHFELAFHHFVARSFLKLAQKTLRKKNS
jgi:hypothetical protein